MRFFVGFLEIVTLLLAFGSAILAVSLFASLTGETSLWLGFVSGAEQFVVQQLPADIADISALSPFIRAMILSATASVLFGLAAYWRAYGSYLRAQAKQQRQERKKTRQKQPRKPRQKSDKKQGRSSEQRQESGSVAASSAVEPTEPTDQQNQKSQQKQSQQSQKKQQGQQNQQSQQSQKNQQNQQSQKSQQKQSQQTVRYTD